MCNEKTLWKCDSCNKRMCAMPKGTFKGAKCALNFHDDAFFGLKKSDDWAMFGRKAGKKWEPSNNIKMKSNANKVEVIKKKIMEDAGMLSTV